MIQKRNIQPRWPDGNVNEVCVEQLHEMFHVVARLVAGISAIFVQYSRGAPVLQLSEATNHGSYTMTRCSVHKQRGLKL